ncbi:MAG: NAD(P)H-dependent glycerol-3-phosphate dehydrogenase [Candidatus Neomarinimicrobiota bacterium]
MNITVLGCGSWGGTISQYLVSRGFKVKTWHKFTDEVKEMLATRRHNLITDLELDESLIITTDLTKALADSNIIIVAVPSHIVREIITEVDPLLPDGTIIVNLAKGIENDSLQTMSQVIADSSSISVDNIVSLYGPSHAEEVAKQMPTTLVSACPNIDTAKKIQSIFSSSTLRVYTNIDILGVELGGSLKNIIAIAAGICDGIGFGDNTKAALLTRGLTEISRLGVKMGADPETFFGLSGIGDLIATCLSLHSRNRYVGEEIGKGRKLDDILAGMKMVAEGVKTTISVRQLREKFGVSMPISRAIDRVLFFDENPNKAVTSLMTRDLRDEKSI